MSDRDLLGLLHEYSKILERVVEQQEQIKFEIRSIWKEINEIDPKTDPKPSSDKVRIL